MAWFMAIVAVALIVWGDDLLKQSANRGEIFSWLTVLGALLYAASAPVWTQVMQTKSLAQIGIMYTALTLVALYLLSWLRYDEPPTNWQLVSLTLAIGAAVTSEL